MDNYNEITLGGPAIDYIQESLKNGKSLARQLVERPDLQEGNVVTFLPKDARLDRILDFTSGGKLPEPKLNDSSQYVAPDGLRWKVIPKRNTDVCLVRHIRIFLNLGVDRICIFENPMALPTDPWVEKSTSPLLIFQNEVYHFLTTQKATDQDIHETIKQASSIYPPFLAVLTIVSDKHNFSKQKVSITSEEIRSLAAKTEEIIVGAYDGESYLIWNQPHPR